MAATLRTKRISRSGGHPSREVVSVCGQACEGGSAERAGCGSGARWGSRCQAVSGDLPLRADIRGCYCHSHQDVTDFYVRRQVIK